jgi:ABC-2 type transport system permease protein
MLTHNVRSIDTIMTALVMPLMILLAFVFVLGGAMNTGPVRYVDFVVPVVLLMCVASGVAYTAFRVNNDATGGMFTRLRTMPIAHSALLGGHMLASVIVNAVSVGVLLALALAIGYRPTADAAGWALTFALLLAAVAAFSAMGVAFGILAKTAEGASVFSYPVIGLLFVSSGFAPVETMPAGLRAFADHQPLTPVINAIRDAQISQPSAGQVGVAFAWLAGLGIFFAIIASWAFRRSKARQL